MLFFFIFVVPGFYADNHILVYKENDNTKSFFVAWIDYNNTQKIENTFYY